jgi:hypothetical protein
MNPWAIGLIIYLVLALGSFAPAALKLIKPVTLHPGGPSFDDSPHFSDAAKALLNQNVDRIRGTLGFWKTRAERFRAVHVYSLFWTVIAATTVPILAQTVTDDPWSKWLVTVISGHAAIMLGVVRSFRVESNYRSFRDGESDYYDLYRRMLDNPRRFGNTEEEQLRNYFEQVELVRKVVRAAETENFPSVEDVSKTPQGNMDD